MNEDMDTKIRAIEFLLTHLISRTRAVADIEADRDELKAIAADGRAWGLMLEIPRQQATDVVERAAQLLDDALYQAGSDEG